MSKTYEIHVISNTHWDREWLYNYQETRLMLVDMLDRLLEVLEQNADYKSYLLDSQTVPLEDYLEIRPENRERIEAQVKSGRLLIGPWYTAPESFSVNGESLARNLLMGHRVAKQFGKVMKIGHTPFGYGQNSQMPQLYNEYGIDVMLFYHGVSHDDAANEFTFEGADGSKVLASQLSSGGRANMYQALYRPVVYGRTEENRWYDWKEGGLPFHLADQAHERDHHRVLNPEFIFDEEALEKMIKVLRQKEIDVSTTRQLGFWSGHDASWPNEAELKLIEAAKKHLGDDTIQHSSLEEFVEKIKSEVKDLDVLKGERRVPKLMNGRVHLYSDVLSSRTRMKLDNARAEYNLQRKAEPFALLASLLGEPFPEKPLELAWKTLLKCHAHDSIAGSGVDHIENDMMNRLQQVNNLTTSLYRRSLEAIQSRIDTSSLDDDAIVLTVYNPSPFPRSEVVTAVIDIPSTHTSPEFALKRMHDAAETPVQIVSRRPHQAVINQSEEATLMMESEHTTIRFLAEELPALGYAVYYLDREDKFARGGLVCGTNAMQNEHIHVKIENDGTLSVTTKNNGHVFEGLHYFEDTGEAGHAWMHIEPDSDRIITNKGRPVQISLEENGPLSARYRVDYSMQIPAHIEEAGGSKQQRLDGAGGNVKRSDHLVDMNITSYFTLTANDAFVRVKTTFSNKARDHRLRVMFPSQLHNAKNCSVESAFDVVEREIDMTPDSPWFGGENATFPMQRFVDVSDGENGLAVVNQGLREYQVDETERCIGVTLMRAYEINLTTVRWRWESHPEMTKTQCPGEHEFEYCIYAHSGTWDEANVHRVAEQLAVPVMPVQSGVYKGDLPPTQSFLEIKQPQLILSALKQSEDKTGFVVRIYNPTSKMVKGEINLMRTPQSVERVTMEELVVEKATVQDRCISVDVAAKKVVTLKITNAILSTF
jgi:mannosylglycerate hydrolase